MHSATREHLVACEACRLADPLGFDFTMAFQPIVDVHDRSVWAHEALVRGLDGAGAPTVLAHVNDANRYRFDQACRTKAVELAASLGMTSRLSINFMPNAIYEPGTCIRTTLATARHHEFPTERLMFEVSEQERTPDRDHLIRILSDYAGRGFTTALDDFGAGFANLDLLAQFQPHVIKLDMALIREIDADPVRQVLVKGMIAMCDDLEIDVVAEGIETVAEYAWLRDAGVRYMQGYLLARPAFEKLPEVTWP